MRFINDGLIAEEIFVPESLLTSVPLKDDWGQEPSRRSSRYHQNNNQVEGIHVPKKKGSLQRARRPMGSTKWALGGINQHQPQQRKVDQMKRFQLSWMVKDKAVWSPLETEIPLSASTGESQSSMHSLEKYTETLKTAARETYLITVLTCPTCLSTSPAVQLQSPGRAAW